MKKSDIILIAILLVVATLSFFIFRNITEASELVDGNAVVYYNNSPILTISLEDGSYNIVNNDRVVAIDESNNTYTVLGTNGDVVIEYGENKVRVIDEISPRNICQIQGWSNSPLSPITCLPNNIIIIIESKQPNDDLPDDITG
jgi:hypothetical protein